MGRLLVNARDGFHFEVCANAGGDHRTNVLKDELRAVGGKITKARHGAGALFDIHVEARLSEIALFKRDIIRNVTPVGDPVELKGDLLQRRRAERACAGCKRRSGAQRCLQKAAPGERLCREILFVCHGQVLLETGRR